MIDKRFTLLALAFGAGKDVVVNGSRAHYSSVRAAYPDAVGVVVVAPPEALRARLARRGREGGAEIEDRLRRAPALPAGLVQIDNDGALEDAGGRLVSLLLDPG